MKYFLGVFLLVFCFGGGYGQEKPSLYSVNNKIDSISASSTLAPGNRDRYDVNNLRDRTDRSWSEGAAGSGVGEYFVIKLKAPVETAGFVLRNGYGNLDYYAQNNRVKSFKIVFDDTFTETVAVKDSYEFEQYRFGKTYTCSKIQFIINEVYPGTLYNDTCIAEITVLPYVISDHDTKTLFIDYLDETSLQKPDYILDGEERSDLVFHYIPFQPNSSAAGRLNARPLLQLTRDLPRIDGATALFPLYASFVNAVYPEPKKDSRRNYSPNYSPGAGVIACSRTAGAYEHLINGEADIIFCYEPSESEIRGAAEKGLRFTLTPIGKDAFVFFVNRNNPLTGLSQQQVRDIYSGRTRNWKSITGRDEPVVAYQRPENSGSQTILQSIMAGESIIEPMQEMIVAEMGQSVAHVATYYNYQSALGYSFRVYLTRMVDNSGIKILAIDGIDPAAETIRNRRYPFVKEIYAVTIAGRETANTKKFIEWIQSSQGRFLVETFGYIPD
jgi:phosphate transport system substrate-binding protein